MALTSKMTSNSNGRPRLACEITVDRVIAARVNAGHNALEVYATRKLPAGSIMPGLGGSNIVHPDAVRQAVGAAFESVSASLRDVTLIIPDPAVRVLLLDFDDLPAAHDEAAAVIRFRARKSVPFDVDAASLSFQADRARRPVRAIAAFSPREVIGEYENIISDSGFAAGVVVPSIVATLGLVNVAAPTMVVKIDGTTSSVSIVNGSNLILLRTLEVPGRSLLTVQDIAGNVLPSMVFYEDTYHTKVERVLITGDTELTSLARALQEETGAQVEPLSTASLGGSSFGDPLPSSLLAPVGGGLLA
jgi:type IV pilus assembly protein PilM